MLWTDMDRARIVRSSCEEEMLDRAELMIGGQVIAIPNGLSGARRDGTRSGPAVTTDFDLSFCTKKAVHE